MIKSTKKQTEREIEIIEMLRKITPEKKQKKIKKVKKIQTIKQNQNVILNIHSPAVQPIELKKKPNKKSKPIPKQADDPFADARPQQPIQTSARNTTFASDFFYTPAQSPFSLYIPKAPTFIPNRAPIQYQQINDNFNEPQFGYDQLNPQSLISNDFPNSDNRENFIYPTLDTIEENDEPIDEPRAILSFEDYMANQLQDVQKQIVEKQRYVSENIDENEPAEIAPDETIVDETSPILKKTRRTKLQMNVIREQKRLDELQKAELRIMKEQNRLLDLQATIDGLTDRRAEALRLAGEAELKLRRDNPQTKKIKVKKPFIL